MKELLEEIERHNDTHDEDEQVDKEEVLSTMESAVEDIMEDLFDVDKIHRKIDRWFRSGKYYDYDRGGISGRVWGLAVIEEVKDRVNRKIYG